ncbi:hypothetical protein GCK72_023046 [Caenorhabditis remanei]|uniref:Uncharacterized protein n=2 Tax=Caenorhabditis remanei TaxID=31234 RepID=A0A6A5FVY9_CAERE|nr:hypothetical protein GCK72_023046 [Caenorhabditis remanei]KAF1746589.1 hypothetical protein GCK72_023046 [Caenorhabditis remanei]
MIRLSDPNNDDLLTIKNNTLRFSDTGITTVGVLFEAHRYEEEMIIEIKHNLPDCFKVYPPDEYSVVNTIIVTYNGLRSCPERRYQDLTITAHLGNREETKNMPRRSIFGNGKARGFQKKTSGFKFKSGKNIIVVRRRASKNHRKNYNNVLNQTKSMEDYSNAQINKIQNEYKEIRRAWWFVKEKNGPYIFLIGSIFFIVLLAITNREMS